MQHLTPVLLKSQPPENIQTMKPVQFRHILRLRLYNRTIKCVLSTCSLFYKHVQRGESCACVCVCVFCWYTAQTVYSLNSIWSLFWQLLPLIHIPLSSSIFLHHLTPYSCIVLSENTLSQNCPKDRPCNASWQCILAFATSNFETECLPKVWIFMRIIYYHKNWTKVGWKEVNMEKKCYLSLQ